MPDRDRAQVYAAEEMAYAGTDLEEITSFDAVVATIDAVVDDPWWPRGPVRVVRARRDACSSSARPGAAGGGEIRLGAAQFTLATGTHELAHVLAGPGGGHGPRFRRAHLDIAAIAFDVERAMWLHDAYVGAGLMIGERRWPEPPVWSSGGAIPL